ncbi:HAD family hydrolase [Chitinophaga pendula]|uniref:HAD-IIB family hydrolase n=1 Tax=Chitinophaga TaxID=79328 RepID=UPI000BAFDB1B|nr:MULTISPECIES: HAD-IIB family hydrolase [Chitinophaga]ASZ09982.1 hypothetical protein CK934_02800 [Chitinophaga sp. MD30]UCJ07075.1 HAD family hydrolase [Chitinophaga pendula]
MLLATDLDGTFLGGSEEDRTQLYRYIRADKNIILVFVTGRGLQSILPLLEDEQMPRPHFIIGDVGATIVHGLTLEPVQPLQDEIAGKWPGQEIIRQHLEHVKGLRFQEVPQERRCSFFYDQDTDIAAAIHIVTDLGCDFIQSAGKYLDVLPKGVNKGHTLHQLIQQLGYPEDKILVAGDTMNDRSLYDLGFKGVVVGGAEPALLGYTGELRHVLQARKTGAGGISEAIDAFPTLLS